MNGSGKGEVSNIRLVNSFDLSVLVVTSSAVWPSFYGGR